MENPEHDRTAEEAGAAEIAGQPGPQAVEALAWAIAQEFVLAFDEFNNAVIEDDEPESLKTRTASR